MNKIIEKYLPLNFEFLRFDKEVYINESKGQILDDIEENKEILETFNNKLNNKEIYLINNNENENEKKDNEIIENNKNKINNNLIQFNKSLNENKDKKNLAKITIHQENEIEDRWPYKIENIYKIYNIGYNINNSGPNILNYSQNHSKNKTKSYADELLLSHGLPIGKITNENNIKTIQYQPIKNRSFNK